MGISIALGTITGCFGGVIRDVLAAIKPLIFRKEIYASAAVFGGFLFAVILQWSGSLFWAQITGIVSTILIRVLAVRFELELPKLDQGPGKMT